MYRDHFTLMGKYNKKFFLALLILPVILLSYSFVEAAGAPSIISYQGRLADSNGDLLGGSGTAYYFKFSIWDNATVGSGTRLWPTSAPSSSSLTVRQGVFTANIGDTAAGFPHALDYDFNTASDIYLQVEVSSDNSTFQTLSPRQRISAAPFARLSSAVSGSTTPSSFGTTTPFGTSVISVEATSTNTTTLSLRSILNQLANIFQVQDSTGTNLLFVNSTGGFFASSTLQATGATRLYSTLDVSGLTTLGQASSTLFSSLDSLSVGRTATTTIRGEINATSTFAGGLSAIRFNTSATSTLTGLRVTEEGLQLVGLNCSGAAGLLQTDASGNVICGTDDSSAGGGITILQVDDSDVVTSASVIDFLGTDFDLTNSPAGEGNLSIDYLNGQAASASLKGFLTSSDWSLFNNKVSSTSIDTSAELISLLTDETGSGALVFGTSPTLSGATLSGITQIGNASTSALSAYTAAFGATATSTFSSTGALTLASALGISSGGTGLSATPSFGQILRGTGTGYTLVATSTLGIAFADLIGSASDSQVSDALTISGGTINNTTIGASTPSTGIFTNATSTNFAVTGIASSLLKTNAGGSLLAAVLGTDYLNSTYIDTSSELATIVGDETGSGALVFGTSPTLSGATLSGITQIGNASTTALSAYSAAFGATATSTFSSTGALTLASALGVSSGGTGLSATPSFGQILRGTGTGYTLVATSTLGIAFADLIGSASDSQVSDALTISGGTINNTTIGASTPATGIFTNATTTNFAVTGIASSLLKTNAGGSLLAAVLGTDYLNSTYIDTSSELASIVGDETGSGALVFGTSPTLSGATLSGITQIANASTTALSAYTAAFGGTATSTFSSTGALTLASALGVSSGGTGLSATPSFGQILRGTGTGYTLVATSTLGIAFADLTGSASDGQVTDALTISGGTINNTTIGASTPATAIFTNATTTNFAVTGIASSLLKTNAGGSLLAAVLGTDYLNSTYIDTSSELASIVGDETGSGALVFGTSPTLSGATLSGITQIANASTTALSALDYFSIGRTATSTVQGNTTGTSTIQGFMNVLGTNSTSTFSGGLAATYLNLTGASATSTAANGINLATGCFAINGVCVGGSTGSGLTSLGPVGQGQTGASQIFATSTDTNVGLTITSAGNTHTFTSTWAGVLASGRGGTGISSVTANQLLIGNTSGTGWTQTATSTLGIAFADLIGSASDSQVSDALTISGGTINNTTIGASTPATAIFTNATTTNFAVTGITSSLLKTNGSGSLLAAVLGTDYLANSSIDTSSEISTIVGDETGSGALVFGTSPTLSGATLSGITQIGNASTTALSAYTAAFGGTATSTFSSTGALTLASALGSGSGGTGLSATPSFGQILRGTGSGYTLVATSTLGIAFADLTGSATDGQVSDALTISGGTINNTTIGASTPATGIFTNATTTNFAVTGITSSLLKTNGSGSLLAAVLGTDYLANSSIDTSSEISTIVGDETGSGALVFGTSPTLSGATLSGITQIGNASTSALSAYTAAFGGTATSTFSSTGALTLASALGSGSGGTGLSATPSFGQILRGTGTGYTLVATSTLGIAFADLIGSATDSQVSDALTISGGTINNTTIGASTPSTGIFTNATSTNFAVTGIASSLLKTNAGGSLLAAVLGTDYLNSTYIDTSSGAPQTDRSRML